MDANIGPETESMGVVVVPLNGKPRIVSRTLGQLETVLRASDYRGPVRVQVEVREGSVGIAQVVPCLGWDHTFDLFEGLRGEVGSLLHGVATGTQGAMGLDREIMLGTRLAVMPWPLGRCDIPLEETKVLGINEDNAKHLWPFGLAMRGGEYFGMGPDGALMTVTAWGSDVRAARQRVLRTIGNLYIREVMYRRDIGEGVQETLARLTSDGWLRSGGDKERAQAGSPGSRVGAGATSGNSLRHPQQTTSAIAHPPVEG
jgi:hypothetical protein